MAHDIEKLRELLERVEAASGPDWELSRDISAFSGDRTRDPQTNESVSGEGPAQHLYVDYTGSLDASIALVERMLPGWGVGFDKRAEFCPIAWVRPNDQRSGADDFRPAATAPLAILSALLRALISQAEGEAKHG